MLSYIFIYFYTLKIRTGDCLQAVCKSQLSEPPSLCQVQNWPIGTLTLPLKRKSGCLPTNNKQVDKKYKNTYTVSLT